METKKTGTESKPKPVITGSSKVSHATIYEALSAFQGELKSIATTKEVDFKTRDGKQIKFKYAPLDAVTDYIYPILGKHGLSFNHTLSEKSIECKVYFTDGTSISSGPLTIAQGQEMKDVGGQITYGRRYTLALALGLSTEEDKDANILESRLDALEKFTMRKTREGIEKATTVAKVQEYVRFIETDLESIKAGKTPSLGLTEDQYSELITLANKKVEEIKPKPWHKDGEAPVEQSAAEDLSGESKTA